MKSYYTEIDIEMCKKILVTILKSERYLPGGLIGTVDFYNNTFKIRKTRPNTRNSLGTVFHGELIKKENGTIIKGEFRQYMGVKVAIGFSGIICSLAWISTLLVDIPKFISGNSVNLKEFLERIIMFPLIFLAMCGFSGIGFNTYKYEENYVLETIETMLEAEEIES